MERDDKSDLSEYTSSVVYHPIEYGDDYPLYIFEYVQKTHSRKRLHFHNGFEIGVCVEGEGLFIIANRVYSFSENCIVFIPADQPHIAQSPDDKPSKWKYITIDPHALTIGDTFAGNMIKSEEMASLALMIFREAERKEDGWRTVTDGLLNALIVMARRSDPGPHTSVRISCSGESIYPAIRFILNNYKEEIRIAELAKMCGYSLSHFRKVFREETGMSPLDYMTNLRLNMASILLRTRERHVSDIAVETGFTSLSSFNRSFRKKYGIPPTEWRKQKDIME